MKHHGQILTSLAALVFFIAVPAILGQRVQQQDPDSRITQEPRPGGDPIRQLNLSPEQLEQIRTIREQNQKERAAINERVRETNRALQAVLEADRPEEAIVEERMRDVSAAQAAAMRMRILTEVRIRRMLTADQRNLLRTLRQQANQLRRERPLRDNDDRMRREEQRGLQNQRNGLGPLFPRRGAQRKALPLNQQ